MFRKEAVFREREERLMSLAITYSCGEGLARGQWAVRFMVRRGEYKPSKE